MAKTLMVQGTTSSAGKSLLVTALCRILKQDGYKVAPFKAQNMALNSFITDDGGEIGRAQACQAEAAGIIPSIHMNPVLLKPQADSVSQVIVHGRALRNTTASDYYNNSLSLLTAIRTSLDVLTRQYDVIVIEGAGSPAEINLAEKDIANMRIADLAKSPVLLIGDIDRGGVFASLVGTMELLSPNQRKLVSGLIINKFRGDISLLKPGLDFLEKRFNILVLGVVPYIKNTGIPQEDSVYLDERRFDPVTGRPYVCIIRLPHVSNYDDFDPFELNCNVRYAATVNELGDPDLIILPGTKSTSHDLTYLRNSGLADAVIQKARSGTPLVGVCGGYQMLGRKIYDMEGVESDIKEAEGLGLLPVDTSFDIRKVTAQVRGHVTATSGLFDDMHGIAVQGYEIHMGKSIGKATNPVFKISSINNPGHPYEEGETNQSGMIFGSYLHGLFHSSDFTAKLIENICKIRGIPVPGYTAIDKEKAYDNLASIFRNSLNMQKIYDIISRGIR